MTPARRALGGKCMILVPVEIIHLMDHQLLLIQVVCVHEQVAPHPFQMES